MPAVELRQHLPFEQYLLQRVQLPSPPSAHSRPDRLENVCCDLLGREGRRNFQHERLGESRCERAHERGRQLVSGELDPLMLNQCKLRANAVGVEGESEERRYGRRGRAQREGEECPMWCRGGTYAKTDERLSSSFLRKTEPCDGLEPLRRPRWSAEKQQQQTEPETPRAAHPAGAVPSPHAAAPFRSLPF
eukprot:scaffold254914_cov41-Tisochrysis_lutea.AAC.1